MDKLAVASDILNAADDALRAAERAEVEIRRLEHRAKKLRMSAIEIKQQSSPGGQLLTYGLLNAAIEIRSKIAADDGISPGHNLAAIRRLQSAMTEMMIVREGCGEDVTLHYGHRNRRPCRTTGGE